MQWSLRSLEVLCLPADIPESIDINVEELDIHDGIKVRDLNYPNLDFANDPEETIVNVIPPALVKEEAPAAATAEGEAAAPTEAKPEEAAEPEVISEKKAEERRAEKEKAKKEEKK
jgi:large subunit ribosomal protein L25